MALEGRNERAFRSGLCYRGNEYYFFSPCIPPNWHLPFSFVIWYFILSSTPIPFGLLAPSRLKRFPFDHALPSPRSSPLSINNLILVLLSVSGVFGFYLFVSFFISGLFPLCLSRLWYLYTPSRVFCLSTHYWDYTCILDPHSPTGAFSFLCDHSLQPLRPTFCKLSGVNHSVHHGSSSFYSSFRLWQVAAYTIHANKLCPVIQRVYPCKSVNNRWYPKQSSLTPAPVPRSKSKINHNK